MLNGLTFRHLAWLTFSMTNAALKHERYNLQGTVSEALVRCQLNTEAS